MSQMSRSQVKGLIGQHVYAVRRDGRVVEGKLVRVNGDELVIEPAGGKAQTQAILPLVLFDLLAIGTSPFAFGGFGFGGFDGFFW